ncbi:MAG: hypothetical protein ACI9JY_001393 [Saprospiraceae bacterium]|jgi:hypothetical protein
MRIKKAEDFDSQKKWVLFSKKKNLKSKNMKNSVIIYIAIVLLFAACKKDVDIFVQNPVDTPNAVYVMTDVGGKIMDEFNTPLAEVAIEIYGKNGVISTSTDENGIFLTKSIEVRQDRLYIKALSNGFFTGSKTITVAGNAIENIEIKLLAKEFIGIINSNVGGVVETENGAKVTFAPNSIMDSNGSPFDGSVQVAARWLNPTSADIFHIMPGNLIGEDSLGREFVMATAGMMAVELFSDNFEKLNIKEGSTAELRFPIPSALSNAVTPEIPLWSFDENKGIWILEGTAQLLDNKYVANVTHFSFWNCDALFSVVNGTGKVIDANGNPVANALVKIEIANSMNTRSSWTNSDGCFGGQLPANETLEIYVCDACGDPFGVVTTITTSDIDVTIPDIMVGTSSTVTQIFGSVVDCDDMPVTNGYVTVHSGTIGQHVFLDANGNFDNTFLYCDDTQLKLVAVDIDTEKMSAGDTFSIAPVIDAGTIQACDELAEFISFNLDGVDYLYADPVDVTGNFSVDEGLGFFDVSQGFSFFANNSDMIVGEAYPVTFMMVTGINQIADYQVEVILTELGAAGELMQGTFTGTFGEDAGTTHSIEGSFKVVRDF